MATRSLTHPPSPFPCGPFDSPNDAEAAVVEAAQNGSRSSFEILVERYQTRILRIALRITRNRQDAEDAAQETLQKAFFHLHLFKRQSTFSTWLTRIAINEALIVLRKNRARQEVPVSEASDRTGILGALETCDPGLTPEAACVEQERKRILSLALNRLSPRIREAIDLRELKDLTTRETAQILGITAMTVKSRVFRGRKKLREVLHGYCSTGAIRRCSALQATRRYEASWSRCQGTETLPGRATIARHRGDPGHLRGNDLAA